MWKYIVKRLLLSVIILLGVSVIIYTLVRLMPTDFIDNKFSSQLSQGSVKQEDVDRMKDLYGLYVPDARITVSFDNAAKDKFGVKTFTQNLTSTRWEDKNRDGVVRDATWFDGKYTNEYFTLELSSLLQRYSVYETFMVYQEYDTKNEIYYDDGGAYVMCYAQDEVSIYKVYCSEYDGGKIAKANTFLYIEGDASMTPIGTKVAEYGHHQPASRKRVPNYGESYVYVSTAHPNMLSSGTYVYGSATNILIFTDTENNEIQSQPIKAYELNGWHRLGCILDGYFTWLGNLAKGDLGMSFKYSQPVSEVIMQDMWISFSISLVALILQFLISIPLGIISATHQYGPMDYVVTILAMIGIALPSFFLGRLLIAFFGKTLGWFPLYGWGGTDPNASSWAIFWDHAHHAVLPIAVLVILSIGSLMRYTRTNMLEVLNADYIRTARAKGLSEKTVVYKHAFKNSMIPLVTTFASILPSLFGGAMITEQVFSIPGIGNKAYRALVDGDVPFIMGYNMFLAILSVIGILAADLMYVLVDPRVKITK